MIDLYIYDIHDNLDIALPDVLSKHIDKYNHEERKNASLVAYSHLVDILTNMGYDASMISFTDLGKPILDGIFFSISHSKKYIAIAISSDLVGVDCEEWVTRLDLSKKILSKNEYQEYIGIDNKIEYLTKKWTQKEAYGKALGSGLNSKIFDSEIEGYTYIMDDACISVYPFKNVVVKRGVADGKSK